MGRRGATPLPAWSPRGSLVSMQLKTLGSLVWPRVMSPRETGMASVAVTGSPGGAFGEKDADVTCPRVLLSRIYLSLCFRNHLPTERPDHTSSALRVLRGHPLWPRSSIGELATGPM